MDDATLLIWIERGKTLAALFVAIGVAGEFLGDWVANPIRTRINAAKDTEIARMNREAAQLQLDLEKERAARLPRTINAQNRAKLLACLGVGPKGPVVVVPKTFDEEAEGYANQIFQVLSDAQFEIRPLTGQRPLGFGIAGAFMFVSDMSHPPPHAGHIQSCFRQIGVELAGYGNPKDVTDPTIVIIAVSSKP